MRKRFIVNFLLTEPHEEDREISDFLMGFSVHRRQEELRNLIKTGYRALYGKPRRPRRAACQAPEDETPQSQPSPPAAQSQESQPHRAEHPQPARVSAGPAPVPAAPSPPTPKAADDPPGKDEGGMIDPLARIRGMAGG